MLQLKGQSDVNWFLYRVFPQLESSRCNLEDSRSCSRPVQWCDGLWCSSAVLWRWRYRLSPSPHVSCPWKTQKPSSHQHMDHFTGSHKAFYFSIDISPDFELIECNVAIEGSATYLGGIRLYFCVNKECKHDEFTLNNFCTEPACISGGVWQRWLSKTELLFIPSFLKSQNGRNSKGQVQWASWLVGWLIWPSWQTNS